MSVLSDLVAEINAALPSNNQGRITAAQVRQVLTDIVTTVEGQVQVGVSSLGVFLADFLTPQQLAGTADATVAIQAAIDHCFAINAGVLILPANATLVTSNTIYQDPPDNLRSNLANPTVFGFSLAVWGPTGANDNGFGCTLRPTFNDKVAWMIGPGNGMSLCGLNIISPYGVAKRGAQNPNGVGIGVAGGGGGASRTLIERCWIVNFYSGITLGANGNFALADSNTIFKCDITNAFYGINFSQTQNFINSVDDCVISAQVAINAPLGQDVRIDGGNFSIGLTEGAAFPLSGISSITVSSTSDFTNAYTFTATVGSPDADMQSGGIYNAFAIATAHFGVIPLVMTAYNTTSHVGTFSIQDTFAAVNLSNTDMVANSDLTAEIQACTTLYAGSQVTLFHGNNITADGTFVENPWAPTMLFTTAVTFGSTGRKSVARNIFFDTDPAITDGRPSNSPTAANLARYYIAMTFPFVDLRSGDLALEDCDFEMVSDSLPFDITKANFQYNIERCRNVRINPRVWSAQYGFMNIGQPEYLPSWGFGGGLYDTNYFLSVQGTTHADLARGQSGQNQCPMWGTRPAGYAVPGVSVAQYGVLTGALPAITGTAGSYAVSYPLLFGGQVYKFSDWYVGPQVGYQFISDHKFWSYGQNLTASWSYKGQTLTVYVADQSLLFPGLGIKLNDGSTDRPYIIRNVFPGLGYITVAAAGSANDISMLSGSSTTIKTGTVIKQDSYSIKQIGESLPLSTIDPLINGALWNNAGNVKVSAGALPTGAVGAWYMDQYQNTNGNEIIPNAMSVVPVFPEQLIRQSRRINLGTFNWDYLSSGAGLAISSQTVGGVVSPLFVAGPDSAVNALRLSITAASGAWYIYQHLRTYPGPGTYTIAAHVRSTAGNGKFKFGLPFDGVWSAEQTATSTWTRFAVQVTSTATGDQYFAFGHDAPAADTTLEFDNFNVYPGSSDLGAETLAGHLRLGLTSRANSYSYSGGVLTSNVAAGMIQFPTAYAAGNTTFLLRARVINPPDDPAIQGVLSMPQGDGFMFGLNSEGNGLGISYGADNGPSAQALCPLSVHPYSGWDTTGFHVYAARWDGANGTFWIDGVQFAIGAPASAAATPHLIDFLFGALTSHPANLAYKSLVYYQRALSDGEMVAATQFLAGRP